MQRSELVRQIAKVTGHSQAEIKRSWQQFEGEALVFGKLLEMGEINFPVLTWTGEYGLNGKIDTGADQHGTRTSDLWLAVEEFLAVSPNYGRDVVVIKPARIEDARGKQIYP